jgi:pimeloyl-ACP methyl ester carboxylesterase
MMCKTITSTITVLLIIGLSISAILNISMFTPSVKAADSGWTLVTDSRPLKAYANLTESIWQKNATMAPNGPYDKIGLHRLVKTGITTKGAVFILPGAFGSGEQLISNPPQSNYSIDESSNQAVYWANRGFDVYAIDYRTHFLPSTMNATQASAIAASWGWDVYISDLKEAVDKAKALSGYTKIFLAGMSIGASIEMFYASEYWKQDLRGLILMDGSNETTKFTPTTNTANATSSLVSLNATGRLALEYPNTPGPATYPSGILFAYQNAVQNPGAPAEWPPGTPLQPTINPLTNKAWANITEWFAYKWNSSSFSDTYGGYGNLTVNIQRSAGADRYFPMRLFVEITSIHDWTNCPFVAYDFDDHYNEINVPVFGFGTGTLSDVGALGIYTNGLATSDFSQIMLPNYGHLDVFTGTYSARDVSEPAYQWMVNHLPQPLAISVNPLSSSVLAGATATFTVTVSGGISPYTYHWYQGTNLLAGQTSAQMSLLTTANNAGGQFPYYCQVTDSEGTNASSNIVTLAVAASPTPTSAPTKQPIVTALTTPSPTPTPSPSPMTTPSPTSSPTPTATHAPVQAMPPAIIIAIIVVVIIIVIGTIALINKRRAK